MHTQDERTAGWWTTFFQGLPVDAWLAYETPERTQSETDGIEKALALAPGARVLDVPCGGGPHAIEMSRRGYEVTGVDSSGQFLAAARAKSQAAGCAVRFDERDMRDLPWQEEFDGVYCVGNSFAYLDDAGNEAFLAGVSRALRPGGRFLLETGVVLESILPNLARNAWYHLQDFYCLAERTHDALAGRLNVNYIFLRDGRREEKAASYRTYSYRELLRLIAESGFEHVASSGHPAGEPYATGSHDLQLVVRKPPRPPGGRPPS